VFGEVDDTRVRVLFATKVILVMRGESFCESIVLWRERSSPILTSNKVPLALLAGCLLLGGFQTAAYASEPPTEEPEPRVPASVDRILGYWQRGEGEAVIEVSQHAGGYHGVIVASERRPQIVGTEVFRQLRYDAEESAWHGRAYSIKRNREVRIDIEVPNTDELKLTAHVLIFTKRAHFKRIPSSEFAARQSEPGL
jgi:uncharacterized protein (DUF2147 family)